MTELSPTASSAAVSRARFIDGAAAAACRAGIRPTPAPTTAAAAEAAACPPLACAAIKHVLSVNVAADAWYTYG